MEYNDYNGYCCDHISIYIYSSMQKNAVKRYENQIITNAEVSGKNIDHYISSMIKAIRSVYINSSAYAVFEK